MNESKSERESGRSGRAERLAEALRANLRRRKAQARARRKGASLVESTEGSGREDAAEHGKKR